MIIKINHVLIVLLLVFSPLANANTSAPCKGGLPISEESLFGSWVESNGEAVSYVTYSSDKTFSGRIEINNKLFWEFSGTWYLKGNIKYTTYTYSSLDKIKAGLTDSDEILEITCSEYKFKNKSGRLGSVQRHNT